MKSNNILTFAVLGIAIGAAAYYLTSTEDGKKKTKKAKKDIEDITKSLKKSAKKSAEKISEIAKNCKTELESIKK